MQLTPNPLDPVLETINRMFPPADVEAREREQATDIRIAMTEAKDKYVEERTPRIARDFAFDANWQIDALESIDFRKVLGLGEALATGDDVEAIRLIRTQITEYLHGKAEWRAQEEGYDRYPEAL